MIDRRRDAADIFTATVGHGYGVKAQAGPLAAGVAVIMDHQGLRGGALAEFPRGCGGWDMIDVNVLGFGGQRFNVSSSNTVDYGARNHETLEARNKTYNAPSIAGLTIPLAVEGDKWTRGHLYRLTQLELAVGVGPAVRIGFNPGELLDFILGWFLIDIYNDDIEMRRHREQRKSNNRLHPTRGS